MDSTAYAAQLGTSLKEARKRRGWTLRQAAGAMGIDHANLLRIEAGQPTALDRYDALARVYGLTLTVRFRRAAA